MGKKSIHPYFRVQVVVLHDVALNWIQISKQLKFSWCCVQNAIKKYKQLGWFDALKHTGRPKKLLRSWDSTFKKIGQRNSRLSASKIAMNLNTSLSELVTTRIIRRYLKDLDFEYLVKIQKQWLGTHRRQQRIAWRKQYLNWAKDDWWKVIFSDESIFYVLKRKKKQCKIWCLEKENLIPECLQQTNDSDGENLGWYLMFWNNDRQGLHGEYQWPIVSRRFRNRTEALDDNISEGN